MYVRTAETQYYLSIKETSLVRFVGTKVLAFQCT